MQSRSVILFMDNATVHPESLIGKYSNIKIVFFPNCTTSRLQQLGAGVIKNFKVKYRKKLMHYMLVRTADETANKIDVIETIEWITSVWKKVSKDTIKNYFAKCRGVEQTTSIYDEENIDDEFRNLFEELSEVLQIEDDIAADQCYNFNHELCTLSPRKMFD